VLRADGLDHLACGWLQHGSSRMSNKLMYQASLQDI
jgi:hypothetical protein